MGSGTRRGRRRRRRRRRFRWRPCPPWAQRARGRSRLSRVRPQHRAMAHQADETVAAEEPDRRRERRASRLRAPGGSFGEARAPRAVCSGRPCVGNLSCAVGETVLQALVTRGTGATGSLEHFLALGLRQRAVVTLPACLDSETPAGRLYARHHRWPLQIARRGSHEVWDTRARDLPPVLSSPPIKWPSNTQVPVFSAQSRERRCRARHLIKKNRTLARALLAALQPPFSASGAPPHQMTSKNASARLLDGNRS